MEEKTKIIDINVNKKQEPSMAIKYSLLQILVELDKQLNIHFSEDNTPNLKKNKIT